MALYAIVAVGAFLRLHNIDKSFWIDEILSYERAVLPLSEVLDNNSYPLSYALIHFALKLGDTEFITRLPSFVAGLLGIWFMYFLGKACHSSRVGVVAAFLLAFNSAHIYYSQDARFYTLLPLGCIIVLWTLLRALQSSTPARYWFGFSSGIVIGSLSHPVFLPFLASVGVGATIAVFMLRSQGGNRLRTLINLCVFGLLGLIPLGIVYLNLERLPVTQLVNTGEEGQRYYLLTLRFYLSCLHHLLLFQSSQPALPIFVIALFGAVLLTLRRKWKALPVLIVPLLLPVPFFFIPVTHWFTGKYFMGVLPSLLIFIAVVFVEAGRAVGCLLVRGMRGSQPNSLLVKWTRTGLLPMAIILLLLEVFAAEYYSRDPYEDHPVPNWKTFAENMQTHMSGDDIIVHFAPLSLNPHTQDRISFEPTPYTFNWYIQRQVTAGRTDLYPTKHLLTASADQLDDWLRKYPNKTFWIVYFRTIPAVPLYTQQFNLFELRSLRRGSVLFVAGAPTRNLVYNGDFENSKSIDKSLGLAKIVNIGSTAEPDHVLALEATASGRAEAFWTIKSERLSTPTVNTRSLEPASYILSMVMKYEDVPGSIHTSGTLTISATGLTTAGKTVKAQLQNFQGTRDWQFYSFKLDSETYSELFAANSIALKIALEGAAGRVWLDMLQLEQGNTPTPFTVDKRLPHDQALDKILEELTSGTLIKPTT